MIRSHPFPEDAFCIHQFESDSGLKSHTAYPQAKAGDQDAALALIADLGLEWLLGQKELFSPGWIYVAPHACEASGDNAIPQTLAAAAALLFQGTVDVEIVQADRVYHTGADAMERMASRAEFDGRVVAGGNYVLVDDVMSLGGTLAELGNYIQLHGGTVRGVLVMANAGRTLDLSPCRKDVRLIKERFKHEFCEIFGIEPDALTANEARYLVGFRSADEIRNRLAKAREEIDRRLRSKGIARQAG